MTSKASSDSGSPELLLIAAMAALCEVPSEQQAVHFGSAPSEGRNWRSRELRPEGIQCNAPRASQKEKIARLYGSSRVTSTTYSQRAAAIASGVKVVVDPAARRIGDWTECLQERGIVRTPRALSNRVLDSYVESPMREDGELSLAGVAATRWSSPKRGPTAWVIGAVACHPSHSLLYVRVNERSPERSEDSAARFTESHVGEPRNLDVFMDAMADFALRQALLFSAQDIFRRLALKQIKRDDAGLELLKLDELYGSMARAVVPSSVWSALTAAFALESRWIRLAQRFLLTRAVAQPGW